MNTISNFWRNIDSDGISLVFYSLIKNRLIQTFIHPVGRKGCECGLRESPIGILIVWCGWTDIAEAGIEDISVYAGQKLKNVHPSEATYNNPLFLSLCSSSQRLSSPFSTSNIDRRRRRERFLPKSLYMLLEEWTEMSV